MYPRASSRILETLTKASSQPVNLAAHFRAFGSTSRVCSATAVAPQSFRARNRTERAEKGDLKQRNGPNYSAERSDPTTNYERPSFRTSHANRVKGKFREVHIAKKVKELCDSGDLDGAIEVCKSAPCGVQGPTAWNIVVKQALEDRRYNLAWELYQQMKKRGVGPSSVTYVTFLSAYAKASPETLTPMHLERAQKFYKSWTDLVTSARTESHLRRVTMIHPAAAYITVLANANAYQAIWDTFYELSSEGPLAPNQYVFTTMFVAFAKRGKVTHPDGDADSHLPSTIDPEVQARNASDAKLLWRMTLRALERQPFPVDAHLLTAVLRALQGGKEEEYQVALDIIEERIVKGLEPGATLDPDLDLNPRLVDAVFAIYESAKRPDLIQRLIDTLRAQNHPHRSAVTTGAMHHLLKTYADQGDTLKIQQTIDWMLREGAIRGGLRVEPGGSTWCLAFRACLAAKDWDTTKELTKRLAGTVNSGRSIDAETIYMVLKSAYVLKPEDERSHERQLRQALDAVYYVVTLWPKNAAESYAEYASKVNPERAERRLVFQNALGDLVRRILEEFSGLSTVSSFHDLTIRLDKLRTNVSKKAVARHQDDM